VLHRLNSAATLDSEDRLNMGPNNGSTFFWKFSYGIQNKGHWGRSTSADDIHFRAAPIGTYK